MAKRNLPTYNTLAAAKATPVDPDSVKAEFARRLQTSMVNRGWNQSELARRATERLPQALPGQKRGHAIGRDLISHYVRGLMPPGPTNLEALASALGVPAADLMPAGVPTAGRDASPFEMRGLPDGRVYIRLSRTVRQDTAMKIMALLADEDRHAAA